MGIFIFEKNKFILSFIIIFFIVNIKIDYVSAEICTYEGVGEYVMSDYESLDIAKKRAKERAEQNAIEQAGVYVESYTKTINSIVYKDEVNVIASGVIRIRNTDYEIVKDIDKNHTIIRTVIKAEIESDSITKWLNKAIQEKNILIEENRNLKEMNIVQEQKIKELKCKIDDTNNGVDIYKHELKHLDAQFISMLKLKEADRYIIQNDYRSANVCLSEAIELYKDNYAAYYMRAYVNYENRNYDKVINDCTLLINKNYNVDMLTVYWMRADAYEKMGENVLAIDDYSKMIRLNPQYENIYIVRGMCFVKEQEYIKAMNDFNEQIKMDSNRGIAYFARGLLHKILGNYNLAKKDFDDAERLGYTGAL